MNKIKVENMERYKDYLVIENENTKVIFSTAEENKSFNRHTEEGIKNLEGLKEDFDVEDVVYLNQVHSDKVFKYTGNNGEIIRGEQGDAIISNCKNSIIGVFTADCVPVILVDEELQVSASIHSGWKGTFSSITKNTITKMQDEYGCLPENIKAFIGPHIRQCCYEVSNELKEKFKQEKNIDENILFDGRNLSMEACILKDLRDIGVKEENINVLPLCTHCTEEIALHSYRKTNGDYGRLFSFVVIK